MEGKNKQIPAGYKDSPLGIIPVEWEVKRLGEIAEMKGGYAFDSKSFIDKGKYQIVKMSNLYEGVLDLSRSQSFINEYPKVAEQCLLVNNDILLTLTGTVGKRDYGYSYQITKEKNLLLNQRVGKITAKLINPLFLYLYLKTSRFLDQFYYSSRGGTGNQSNVGVGDVLNINILLPPLPEQQRIAEVLGAWDQGIELQAKLVESFQKRKRALMQQLLTGKKRLKGFDQAWKIKKIGSILSIGSGKDYKHLKQGNTPVFGTGGYMTSVDGYLYDGETVCIGRKGTIDSPFFYSGKIWTVDTLFYTHKFKGVLPKYIYFYFSIINWRKYNEATGVPSLSKLTIENILVNQPPLPEQQAIAEILTAADREIELAQKKLEVLREQKRGLMQQLLTGKKRLKV